MLLLCCWAIGKSNGSSLPISVSMLFDVKIIAVEISKEVIKILSGKLLTESQIQSVSKHVVGRYFADLLPTPENEAEAEERIASARMHITEASK
jgi:hypothetical protein